jgi:hypothetical protein
MWAGGPVARRDFGAKRSAPGGGEGGGAVLAGSQPQVSRSALLEEKIKFWHASMKTLTNCENLSSNPLQTACCGIQEAACDSVNCSVSRRLFWSVLLYYFSEHWRCKKCKKTISVYTKSTDFTFTPSKKWFISWHCPFKSAAADSASLCVEILLGISGVSRIVVIHIPSATASAATAAAAAAAVAHLIVT